MSRPISAPARRTIFEAMVAMAWADARIEREEVLAVQAAGRVLQIPGDAIDALDEGAPSIRSIDAAPLDPHERKLVYLCAAWLACVDANEEESEESLLDELRASLSIGSSEATELRDEARYLRSTSPASLRWHEELSTLITHASARIGR